MLGRVVVVSLWIASPALAQTATDNGPSPEHPAVTSTTEGAEGHPSANDDAPEATAPASSQTQDGAQAAPATPPAAPPEAESELEVSEGIHPLLLLPIQAAVGAAVGLLSSLVFPIAPFIVAFVVASTGDLLGQQRGPVLWPMVGGYIGMALGALGPPTGWGLVFAIGAGLASLGLLLGAGMTMAPWVFVAAGVGVALLYVTGASTFIVPVAVAALGAAGNGLGAAIGYYLSAENKHPGDVEFRFPGFIAPSHGPDRLIVFGPDGRPALRSASVASARAMAY